MPIAAHDASVADPDIGALLRTAGAVDDIATAEHDVEHPRQAISRLLGRQSSRTLRDRMTNDRFGSSFVDVDEWRDAPVPHRYVHGGFQDSVACFSFYFPPPELYEGRYVHLIEGGVGGNDATLAAPGAPGGIELAFALGAYTLESNQGHVGLDLSGEPSVMVWEASARVSTRRVGARYRDVRRRPASRLRLRRQRRGLRTIACLEHAADLYDGAVPFIAGSTNGGVLPVTMSAVANALRLLWPKFDAIADVREPGGSGNPYEGLDADQRDTLAVLYRCGFPRGAEAQLADHGQALNIWAWDAPTLLRTDPGYFADFWTVPGYAGTGHALAASVIEEKTHVLRVLTGRELASAVDVERGGVGRMMAVAGAGGADVAMAIVVDGVELPIRMIGASFTFTTGAAAGRRLYCIGAVGDALMSSAISGPIYDGVSVGDELVIDNRDWLAFCYYHRHQVRDDNHATRQFVVDGKPVYPQRPLFPMTELRSTTRAGDHSGRFVGKMIVVQNTCDDYAWPHAGHMYGLLVREALGDSFDDQFRLWYNDHAAHLPAAPTSTRLVNYRGSVEQALRDVIEWVEHGTAPPPTTGYRWHDESSALTLAATAAERRGIQPVVTLRVEGGVRADARVDEIVTFEAIAEVPPGTGALIRAEWDFDGAGGWPAVDDFVDGSQANVTLTADHTFDAPGVYFPSVRVTAHRDGDPHATLFRVVNLARVRVVVS